MLTEYQPPPLILVVDDDVFVRGMLQNLLEKQGYRVTTATDGINALAAVERCRPNLVLMDAVMPVMDGFRACAELQKLPGAEIPVIMVTSLDDEPSVNKAFEVGAVEYITKPVHWAVLRHRLHVILQTRYTQAALRKSEARFRGIFEQAAVGIALVNMDGKLIDSNPATQKMLGLDESSLRGKLFHEFFFSIDSTTEKDFYQQLLEDTRDYYQMEKYFFRENSGMLWVLLTTSLVRGADNTPQFFVQMIEDITEHKRTLTSKRLATKVFEKTTDAVIITNAEGNIIDANQAFLSITGYDSEEVLGKNPRFLQSGYHDKAFYERMWNTTLKAGSWHDEIYNRRKNGEIFSTRISISTVQSEHNKVIHYVAVYSDIKAIQKQ
jgi:PAS domain S-box-containing protein